MAFKLATAVLQIVADVTGLKSGMEETRQTSKEAAQQISADFKEIAKTPFPDGPAKGMKKLGEEAVKGTSQVDFAFKRSQKVLTDFQKKFEETGIASRRQLKDLVGSQNQLERAIHDTYGSLSKATPEARAHYEQVKSAVKSAKREVEEFEDALQDQRMEIMEGGAAWRGLGENVNVALGKYGRFQAQGLAVVGALAAGWQIGRRIGEAIGVDYQAWDDFLAHAGQSLKPFVSQLGELELKMFRLVGARFQDLADETAADKTLAGAKFGTQGDSRWLGPAKPGDDQILKNLAETEERQRAINEQLRQRAVALDLEAAKQAHNFDLVRKYTLDQIALQRRAMIDEFGPEAISGIDAVIAKARHAALAQIATEQKQYRENQLQAEQKAINDAFTLAWIDVENNRQAIEEKKKKQKELTATILEELKKQTALELQNAQMYAEMSKSTLVRVAEDYKSHGTTIVSVMSSAAGSVESVFTDVMFEGITGQFDKIDDSFKSFLDGIRRQILNFLVQKAVMKFLEFFSGGSAAGSMAANTVGILNSLGYKADGGIFGGGFHAFANGAPIVDRPTFGLVGEGKYNEAVIPLPDGRAVEAKVYGAGGAQQINQTIVLASDFLRAIGGGGGGVSADQIITVVSADILKNGKIRRAIKTAA